MEPPIKNGVSPATSGPLPFPLSGTRKCTGEAQRVEAMAAETARGAVTAASVGAGLNEKCYQKKRGRRRG